MDSKAGSIPMRSGEAPLKKSDPGYAAKPPKQTSLADFFSIKRPLREPKVSDTLQNDSDSVYTGEIGEFRGNVVNHGVTGEFDGHSFPHSETMMQVMHSSCTTSCNHTIFVPALNSLSL